MSITIAGLWREGRELSERHAATVVPIAAAFIFLPQVIQSALLGPVTPGLTARAQDVLAFFIVTALAFLGQLAIASIMLGGRDGPYDVADSLRRAARLVPRALLIVVVLGLAVLPLFLVIAIVLAFVVGPEGLRGTPDAMRAASVAMLPIVVLFVYFAARFFVVIPTLVSEGTPVLDTIRRSWRLTGGAQRALVGFVLSALVVIIFLTAVINIVAGAILGLLLGAGSPLGQLLAVTLGTLAATAVGVITIGAWVTAYRALADAR